MSEDKEAEKLRKAAEKLALNAADEESTSDVKKAAKTKKKGKDDFDMLNATLAKMPKTKAMKDAEAKAIVDAERKKKDAEAREAKEARLKVRMTNIDSTCTLFRLMLSQNLNIHSLITPYRLKVTLLRS
jgi:hypothetical protein